MTPKEFLLTTENIVLTEMVKEINQLMNQGKTNFLSLGLFLKLPVEFTLQQTDKVPFNKRMSLPELSDCFSSTVYQHTSTTIQFTFLYNNEKHLKHLVKVIAKYPTYFAYHYVKQLQHVLRNHYTTAHQSFMLRNTSAESPFEMINLANDFSVNTSLQEIFKGSELTNKWKEIKEVVNYNPDYKGMNEVLALKDLTGSSNRPSVRKISNTHSEITFKKTKYIVPATTNNILKTDDTEFANLATRVYDTIRTASRGSLGLGCQTMMEQFESVETDTEWFKKLKVSFEKTVFHKTESFKQTWKQLNNRYRHIAPMPTAIYKQSKINLILSIDQSGSMSTQDLQKLLYLIEKNSKRIAKCKVLVHTATLDKTFTLKSDYDITESPKWKFLKARLTDGGTSHACVFEHIQDNIKNPEEYVYISLSDNYSDIEQCIKNYPVMSKISKYWLSPIGSKQVHTDEVGGINITMT